MKRQWQLFSTILFVSLSISFPSLGLAEPPVLEAAKPPVAGQPQLAKDVNPVDFAGLGFGTGVSLTWDNGGEKDRVKSARIINGIVRVENEDNTQARIMLEIHHLFQTDKKFFNSVSSENWGHGPFVALQPGTDEIIEAIGIGWMVAFRKPGNDKSSSNSFNLGIGFVVDPNVQVLGDGIEPNRPLPAGETEIRYKEETETGLLLLASFQF